MRTNRLAVLAAVSLALLATLLCGYFTTFGPACIWYTPVNATTATLHGAEIKLDRGGFRIVLENVTVRTGGWMPTGFRVEPSFKNLGPGLPRARLALWGFQAGAFVGRSGFTLAFPIWCLAVLCTFAPLRWLRRRHNPHPSHGFAVGTSGTSGEK